MKFANPPSRTDALAWVKYSAAAAKRFTYVDRFDEEIMLFRQEHGMIGCPRAAFPVAEDDQRVRGPKIGFKEIPWVPRAGQAEFVRAGEHLLLAGESFVAQAPTGFGKTVVATQMIKRVGRPTLIIVTKEDLLEQWEAEIQKWLGEDKVGLIQADTWDVQRITLAMVHTLAQRGCPADIAKQFGFVIWDEVHRVGADTFSQTSMQFPALLRMGLSATPNRLDGREAMIFDSIGPIRVVEEALQLTPAVACYKSPWASPRWRCKECKGHGCPGCDGSGYRKAYAQVGKTMHLEKDLAAHPERNAMLLKIIKQAYARGRRIVVFSSLTDHLRFLRQKSVEHMQVPAGDTALYISGLTKKQRAQAQTKRIMFATWGMMGEGTDIPWLDVAVLATPRANIEQPVGRVLREYPDKPQPVVVDICDWDHPVFEKYALKRRKSYAGMKAGVKEYALT